MSVIQTPSHPASPLAGVAAMSKPLQGTKLSIGRGFCARSFRAQAVGTLMDPLVMVDHYVMTEDTFGAHPHAGLSAVSLLFEDSEGLFRSRDSLGNDFDLRPGDLYWLKAGSGAVHDESPRVGARTHGLQVFVNMPQSQRFEAPESLLVRAEDMPVITAEGYRVKVAMGESNGVFGARSPAIPMTILVGAIQPSGHFVHGSASNRGIWVQAIEGDLELVVDEQVRSLDRGEALTIRVDASSRVRIGNPSKEPARFALFDGERIDESYVHNGPFVMGSEDEIAAINAAYDSGKLGQIPNSQ